jgi:hypothetical protein
MYDKVLLSETDFAGGEFLGISHLRSDTANKQLILKIGKMLIHKLFVYFNSCLQTFG